MTPANDSVLIVAGEASGDLHGSKVVARLRELAPHLSIYGVGGDRMGEAGMDLAFHADDFAVVGLVEVARLVPRLRRAMRDLVATVRTSTEGARTLTSPTKVSRRTRALEFWISATSVEVPPMSKVRMSSKPARLQK